MKSFRITEWYNSKVIFFLSVFFLLGSVNSTLEFDFELLKKVSFVFLYLIIGASLGYYINDFFDKEKDKLVQKSNFAQQHSLSTSFFILILLKLFLFITWYFLSKNEWVGLLILLQIVFFYLYSQPFPRLKEWPIVGLFIDAIYAFIFPFSIVFFTLHDKGEHTFLFLVGVFWLLFVGLKGIIKHQIGDVEEDKRSKTTTATKLYSIRNLLITYKILLSIPELIFFSVFLSLINNILFLAYLLYLVYVFFQSELNKKLNSKSILKPKLNVLQLIFKDFYYKWLFVVATLNISLVTSVWFLLLLPFYILLFRSISKLFLTDFKYVYNVIYNVIYVKVFIPSYFYLFGIASFIVNYSLYFFFLLFGVNLKEKHKEKHKTSTKSMSEKHEIKADIVLEKVKIKINKNVKDCIFQKRVHSMWVGSKLSNMELLTINSFIFNGYEFHLWVYEKLLTPLPEDIIIKNANEIIPKKQIFTYKNQSQFNTGKGSVAGFSDVFRYKLLYEKGGWWVDMDVTCLKPFDVSTEYFFRAHHNLPLVGNVMKAPKNSPLMKACYEAAKSSMNENNQDWHKPINILIENVKKFGLEEFIYSDISNTDEFYKLEGYYFKKKDIPKNWLFIHWCNEELRNFYLDKNQYFYNSTLGSLLRESNVTNFMDENEALENDKRFKRELLLCNLLNIL